MEIVAIDNGIKEGLNALFLDLFHKISYVHEMLSRLYL